MDRISAMAAPNRKPRPITSAIYSKISYNHNIYAMTKVQMRFMIVRVLMLRSEKDTYG